MYTVTKTFHIAAAHRLMHYTWPCRFIHGHNFVITLTLQAPQPVDEANWFVYDFKDLNVFKQFVEQKYDHAFLTQQGDEIGDFLESQWHKVVFFTTPPSTEYFAKKLFNEFLELIVLPEAVTLVSVHVQETPTAWATYSE